MNQTWANPLPFPAFRIASLMALSANSLEMPVSGISHPHTRFVASMVPDMA